MQDILQNWNSCDKNSYILTKINRIFKFGFWGFRFEVDLVNFLFYDFVDLVNRRDRMKRSTKRIIETFPKFKWKLKAYENILLVEEALNGLTKIEAVFLRLAWFFEEPEHESFNMDCCIAI
jgi:hypothetical protein